MDNSKITEMDYRHWGNVSRSILNGVIGDYLVQQNNPLAIEMGFYHQNTLVLRHDDSASLNLHQVSVDGCLSNKVVVLLHGLTNLETIWDFDTHHSDDDCPTGDDNYGLRLQQDFGFTPLYLRYNTGLPIEENGRQFARLMDRLVTECPVAIDEIVLVGFSMGGLLMRYAQKAASESAFNWLDRLTHCFYLGTPHEGSHLEKFGHMASAVVRAIPRPYISQWADWIDVRSEGIQDLKNGLAHLNDAADIDAESASPSGSFYLGANHHFVSGSLSPARNSLLNKWLGDSLVRHPSANPDSAPEGSQFAHFDGVPHIPLAHSNRVYQQIKAWLETGDTSVALVRYEVSNLELLNQKRDSTRSNDSRTTATNKALLAGAIDLLAVGYEKTVDAVESMHLFIAKEPYAVLQKIPVTRPVSEVVDATHTGISESIYRSVRLGGKLIHGASTLLKNS